MIDGASSSSVNLPLFLAGRTLQLSLQTPCIVGILNVTPDSFSDGGRYLNVDAALAQARRMAAEGARLIDVGGESTRPGAQPVSSQEELDRILPIVEALRSNLEVPISVDTCKSSVARCAVAAGAEFVNDVSGLNFDPDMAHTVAETGAGLIVMHSRGRPERMQLNTHYQDIVAEVCASLRQSLDLALAAGITADRIAIDPGIGFGKDVAGNLELLRRLAVLTELGRPILLGTSRKSFIGRVLGQEDPAQRLEGSLATIALGVAAGARLFRVHDVAATQRVATMSLAVCQGADWVA